jgi:tRNA nucleotidyltransferase (CCA-adding enzyme)
MAIPLRGEPRLIDPHGGEVDLAARQLRVLHDGSFVDDPTRALRAARYAARFGFELEAHTAELIRETRPATVSADRREAELLRLAAEENAASGFALLAEWGLLDLRAEGVELVEKAAGLLGSDLWRGVAPRDRVLLAAALGPPRGEVALASADPERPSRAVELAAPHDGVELVLGRALGGEWLDRYVSEWRDVALEIDGSDLIGAGLSQGPALGRGLEEALRRKLDGEASGREQELAVALETARGSDGVA